MSALVREREEVVAKSGDCTKILLDLLLYWKWNNRKWACVVQRQKINLGKNFETVKVKSSNTLKLDGRKPILLYTQLATSFMEILTDWCCVTKRFIHQKMYLLDGKSC